MKKPFLIIAGLLLIWITLNSTYWILMGLKLKSLSQSPVSNLPTEISTLQNWVKYYPYISLGGHQLPYLNTLHHLTETGLQLASESLDIATKLQPLGSDLLSGHHTNLGDWEEVFSSIYKLQPQLDDLTQQLNQGELITLSKLLNLETQRLNFINTLSNLNPIITSLPDLQPALTDILGFNTKKHYVVLNQNNMELRPTGGYMGSYIEFWIDNGTMKDLKVEAIGVPNGQIKGYVKGPAPIDKYIHQGGTPGWSLRDSNWNPDFPKASKTIAWFFHEGKLDPIDGMIAVNLIPIIDVLEIIGPIDLPDYNLTTNAQEFYQHAQSNSETDFFKGSTQKRDFLGYAAKHILFSLTNNASDHIPKLLPILYRNLNTKQIMITSNNEILAQWLDQRNWDGHLFPINCSGERCIPDYIHVNEANLGINKTNCCLDRQFDHQIQLTPNNQLNHHLSITFTNHNPGVINPPHSWGGGYEAYTRIYLPKEAQYQSIFKDSEPLPSDLIDLYQESDKSVIAFLASVGSGKQHTFHIKYTIPLDQQTVFESYQLTIQKQSGVESIPWNIQFDSDSTHHQQNLSVDKDTTLTLLIYSTLTD